MSTVNEEIAAVKAEISDLEKRIAAAEIGGRSQAYIILRQQLVSTKNELVELMKDENILLKYRQGISIY